MMRKVSIIVGLTVAVLSAQASVVIYSNDGSIALGGTSVTNGTIGGVTGDFISVDSDYVSGGAFLNVNFNLDLSAYDGQEWTLSYDVFSHADIDDNVYSSVQSELQGSGGAAGNFYNLDGQATWQNFTRSGTVAYVDGNSSRILFVSNTQSTGGEAGTPPRYYLDNISVTVIPEPGTIGLVGAAGLALLGLRRLRMM